MNNILTGLQFGLNTSKTGGIEVPYEQSRLQIFAVADEAIEVLIPHEELPLVAPIVAAVETTDTSAAYPVAIPDPKLSDIERLVEEAYPEAA